MIKQRFDLYVDQLAKGEEESRGKSSEGEIDSHLQENKEHIVFYAKSLNKASDLNFICGTYNVPTVAAYNIAEFVSKEIRGLHRYHFKVRGICADSAQAQESYFKQKADLTAGRFIPFKLLRKYNLSGDINVAFLDRYSKEQVFIIM